MVPGYTVAEGISGYPSPSPDGTRVAYFREGFSRNTTLGIVNVTTGAVVARDIPGHAPEWSHGDLIARYLTTGDQYGRIMLMSGTGTGSRALVNQAVYRHGMDWAPDDRWIVVANAASERLELVEVATGQVLPLAYTAGMYEPAWKP